MRVLVVDDEPGVQAALRRALELDGYEVVLADHGRQAIELLANAPVDALVLDVSMPVLGGLATCRHLRETGDETPILMLTARDAIRERVDGLDAGADDYLVKPFALTELRARLRALLRRRQAEETAELVFADLVLDPQTRDVHRGGRRLQLTRTEYNLLEYFMENPRRVLTRQAIFEHVWSYDLGPSTNSLGVYMGYLRRKTEADGQPRLLHTVRGVGYILRDD
jgi:two-component system response regulator MprA